MPVRSGGKGETKASLGFRPVDRQAGLVCRSDLNDSHAAIARLADSSQENFFACRKPCSRSMVRKAPSCSAWAIFRVMAVTSKGSNRAASSPMASGRLEVLAPSAGGSQATASKLGSPSPSCKEEKTKILQSL